MGRRAPQVAAIVIAVFVLATIVALRVGGATAAPATPAVQTGTAAVVRTTITSRQQVNGTLGYGQPLTLPAPAGTTPEQVTEAQASYDAAAVQLRNARSAQGQPQDVAAAQAALDRVRISYQAAKSRSTAVMDSVYADLQGYRSALDTIFTRLDQTLGELPLNGSDAHAAQSSLYRALAPIGEARNAAADLLGPRLGDYQRARNDLAAAIGGFDRASGAGADTAQSSATFATALMNWSAAATRLQNAIDATNGPLAQVASGVATAQAALNMPLTRYDSFFDQTRTDLSSLMTSVTSEQQLALASRMKIAQATTEMNTVADAIAGSLAIATQNVAAASRQADQSARLARATTDAAAQQFAAASTRLDDLRATAALGAGTLSWLPRPGATIQRGDPLYAVDGRPIPLLIGALPMYRSLFLGRAGADVRELEDNLIALGFAATPDGSFDDVDAEALRAWQASLGASQTGELKVGEVVFLPSTVRVSALRVDVGSPYVPGQPVIDVTDSAHIVTVLLDASLQSSVKVGDPVTVQVPGRSQAAAGRVAEMSAVAQAPSSGNSQQGPVRATVNLTVRLDDPSAGGSLDQAPVRVSITDQVRTNVLAVPVISLVARADGSFIVRVVHGSARDDVVVVPGVFGDNGLVEVSGAGLTAGDQVEVPKPL